MVGHRRISVALASFVGIAALLVPAGGASAWPQSDDTLTVAFGETAFDAMRAAGVSLYGNGGMGVGTSDDGSVFMACDVTRHDGASARCSSDIGQALFFGPNDQQLVMSGLRFIGTTKAGKVTAHLYDGAGRDYGRRVVLRATGGPGSQVKNGYRLYSTALTVDAAAIVNASLGVDSFVAGPSGVVLVDLPE